MRNILKKLGVLLLCLFITWAIISTVEHFTIQNLEQKSLDFTLGIYDFNIENSREYTTQEVYQKAEKLIEGLKDIDGFISEFGYKYFYYADNGEYEAAITMYSCIENKVNSERHLTYYLQWKKIKGKWTIISFITNA